MSNILHLLQQCACNPQVHLVSHSQDKKNKIKTLASIHHKLALASLTRFSSGVSKKSSSSLHRAAMSIGFQQKLLQYCNAMHFKKISDITDITLIPLWFLLCPVLLCSNRSLLFHFLGLRWFEIVWDKNSREPHLKDQSIWVNVSSNEQICVNMLIWVNMPRIMSQWWHFSTFIAFLWRLSDYHTRYDAVSAPLNLHRMPNRLVHLPVRPPWHGALEFLVTPNFLQDAIGCRPALILSHAISCYYMLLVLLNFVPFDALLISVEVKNSQVFHRSKLEEVTLWPCSKRWPVTSSKDDWNVGRIGPTATNGSTGRLEVLQVRAGIKPPQKDHWHWTDMSI